MAANPPAPKCQWRDGEQCQFEGHNLPIHAHEGRAFCRAHAPPTAAEAMGAEELATFVATVLAQGTSNLAGIHFRPRQNGSWTLTSNAPEALLLRHCTFHRVHSLAFGRPAVLDDSRFIGRVDLQFPRSPGTSMRRVVFEGPAAIFVPEAATVDLTEAEFKQDAGFPALGTAIAGAIKLDQVRFHCAPTFGNRIAQATTFHGTKFLKSARRPDDEGTYRALRNNLNQNRAREWEGIAYEQEQLCQRAALFRERRFLAWITSLLYGTFTRYGHSYERALISFACVQIAFGFLYSWKSGRLGCCNFDGSVFLYTWAQVLKPFESLSAKLPPSSAQWAHDVVSNDSSIFWPVATGVQSLLSLSLVALALLAMRWRFRRE